MCHDTPKRVVTLGILFQNQSIQTDARKVDRNHWSKEPVHGRSRSPTPAENACGGVHAGGRRRSLVIAASGDEMGPVGGGEIEDGMV